jgi:hypothetical protein
MQKNNFPVLLHGYLMGALAVSLLRFIYDAVSRSLQRRRKKNWWMEGFGKKYSWINRRTLVEFSWRNWGKPRKASHSEVGVSAEIRTCHILYTDLARTVSKEIYYKCGEEKELKY